MSRCVKVDVGSVGRDPATPLAEGLSSPVCANPGATGVANLGAVSAAPVFALTLPLEVPMGFTRAGKPKPPLKPAATMNEYANQRGWVRAAHRACVDQFIHAQMALNAKAEPWNGDTLDYAMWLAACGRKRRAVVTRYSSRQPDEIACDALGAKYAFDRLVHAAVLYGDSAKWLQREARWVQCKPGEGRLVVEIFDL